MHVFSLVYKQRMAPGQPRLNPRNYPLAKGISRYSRSAMYAKKALYKNKIAVKNFAPKRDPHVVIKEVGGSNNGGKRVVLVKRSVGEQCSFVFSSACVCAFVPV